MVNYGPCFVYFCRLRSRNRFIRRSQLSTLSSFFPLYTVGLFPVWSLSTVNGASSLEIAFDIASVCFSCSGEIGMSSVAAGGLRLLPLVDLMNSSEVPLVSTSFCLKLLALDCPGAIHRSRCEILLSILQCRIGRLKRGSYLGCGIGAEWYLQISNPHTGSLNGYWIICRTLFAQGRWGLIRVHHCRIP